MGPIPVDKSTPAGAAPSGPAVEGAMRNGLSFYESLQQDDGHWPGDYGGTCCVGRRCRRCTHMMRSAALGGRLVL